ncbi:alpha/beta fold hydrolase [Baekduia soli]|uniref:Alpha/beta fold hydrolase n=1 Tax=Baekduia soli TaxID=496014 RepID=A0A5B8U1P0_9ACTN|nr:haloalkane dehalogenase [Baekduia soli]QEC46906.1 alpha/beta fold hydrolase [Baekduia soli]
MRAVDHPLQGFPHPSRYTEIGGVRLAYLDLEPEGAGDAGPPVWFMHGEPTWSYLWREVIGPVRAAGHRCIAPDLAGFGRSDKPEDLEWYTYDRHTELMGALLEQLDLHDLTMVVHDWGGPIGLRLAVQHPDRIARLVILDTGLFTGEQRMTDNWLRFRDFVRRTEDLPISFLVDGATLRALGDEEKAAYDAPFETPASKAGARAFPLILPTDPSMPGAEAGRRVLDAMRADTRPKLVLWADQDPVLPLEGGRAFAKALGAPEPEVIAGAAHFLQEDAGAAIGQRIAAWLGDARPGGAGA